MYPDFLCIGAQKAGTSWLYKNLRNHPEIWLPPKKEIHYFDLLREIHKSRRERMQTERWKRWFMQRLRHDFRTLYRQLSLHEVPWDVRYFFGKMGPEWYASLFEPGREKVTGDITPAYAIVNKDVTRHAFEIMPDAKLIFILRNPMERAWSMARMAYGNKGKCFEKRADRLENVPDKQFISHFELRASRLRGDYLRTLNNWLSFFPEQQMLIAFLEDIARRPSELLIDIYKFLGVNASEAYLPKTEKEKVHAKISVPIPDNLGRYLAQMYYRQIQQLAHRVSGHQAAYIQEWLEMAETFLDSGPRHHP